MPPVFRSRSPVASPRRIHSSSGLVQPRVSLLASLRFAAVNRLLLGITSVSVVGCVSMNADPSLLHTRLKHAAAPWQLKRMRIVPVVPNDQLRDAGPKASECKQNALPAFPGASCSARLWVY